MTLHDLKPYCILLIAIFWVILLVQMYRSAQLVDENDNPIDEFEKRNEEDRNRFYH